jgi:threonine aldolase
MAEAEVGDDVLGDDPTVIELERRTAEVLGKEAAIYTPSGTMANQLGVRCHTQSGDEILLADNAHVYWYEAGAPAVVSGVMVRHLPSERGIFGASAVTDALRPSNVHFAPARLVCLENTNNRGGGSIWPIETMRAASDAAREAGLAVHLDGARLWNAAVASGTAESHYAACCDSVSVCFSKGLGAPVGSALAGTAETIARARRFRKMLGGGMRQAGVIAAGALHALEHHRKRLAADHANARALAEGLAGLPAVAIDPSTVETNIVYFDVAAPAGDVVKSLERAGVGMLATGEHTIRAVTHLHITREDIDAALAAMTDVVGAE